MAQTEHIVRTHSGGMYLVFGTAAFATTDLTVELNTKGLKWIYAAFLTHINAAHTDVESLEFSETLADGKFTVDADKQVTVTRLLQSDTGGTPAVLSAAAFSYLFIGSGN